MSWQLIIIDSEFTRKDSQSAVAAKERYIVYRQLFAPQKSRAFIEVVVILILAVALAVGGIFLKYSTQSVDSLLIQSHRIKARNLANAAYQRALLTLRRQYTASNYNWSYPEHKVVADNLFERELGDGRYKVIKVETVKNLKTPIETITKTFQNTKYLVGNTDYGNYEVYRITTMGEIPSSGTRVKMTSLVKVIREKVRY